MGALLAVKLTLVWGAIFDDILELVLLYVVEGLALAVERFKGFDDGLCHAFVGLLRAAEDGEAFGLGDALVAVFMIEADADYVCRWFLRRAVVIVAEAIHKSLIKVWCSQIGMLDPHAADVAKGAILFKQYFI